MKKKKNIEKYSKIAINKKYGDVSFCSKEDCNIKTCCKHICHNSNRYYVSVIDYWKDESCHIKENNNEKED